MIPFQNHRIENLRASFSDLKSVLRTKGFVLGGGYEYDHGYFDKALDWENDKGSRYYLRVPVYAVEGNIGRGQRHRSVG